MSGRTSRRAGGRTGALALRRAVHGEWTKLRTLPGQVWTLAGLPVAMAGLTAVVAAAAEPGQQGTLAPTAVTLSGVYLAQTVAALLAIGVVSGEYPRVIRLTLAASPRRDTVFLAKTALVVVTVLVAAAVAVPASLLVGRTALPASVAQLPYSSHMLWRASAGTLVYLVLVALLGAGVALLVRHAASAAGAVMALLYGPYLVTLIVRMPVHALHRVQKISPMSAGLAVQTTTGTGTAPLAPWTGIAVLGAYAAGALLLGWAALRWRDA
ncbi:hypothetical protein [Streptomyces sp. KL116D]|uniref:hypothetical protein n=1 Tax=Streptomyces sp. KL116D TaxID=3045152 RepID=UPI003556C6E0